MDTKGQDKKLGIHILLVDDEAVTLAYLTRIILDAELGNPVPCNDPRLLKEILRSQVFDAIVLDLHMPWVSGKEILDEICRDYPDVPVLIMTSEDSVETAVSCMRVGAFDYLTKPLDKNRFVPALRHALVMRDLRREVQVLAPLGVNPSELAHPELFSSIITQSPRMRAIFSYIEAIAPSPRAVLIRGESGTGKELIARVIHNLSGRSGAFIPVNVSGLDDTIFSDTLFGHVRGAFTGAEAIRKGLVEQAYDGTLFLDEIGDLVPSAQIKLLRLLQEGEYYPLGSDKAAKSKARIITATNADLTYMQESGGFRRDLYWRLISHQIELPPLRDRREDLPLLVDHFAKDAAKQLELESVVVEPSYLWNLRSHPFIGNIRELQAMVFDAVSRSRNGRLFSDHEPRDRALENTLHTDTSQIVEPPSEVIDSNALTAKNLENQLETGQSSKEYIQGPGDVLLGGALPTMEELEDFFYSIALARSKGKQSLAAQMLGVSQPTLSRWLKKQATKPRRE